MRMPGHTIPQLMPRYVENQTNSGKPVWRRISILFIRLYLYGRHDWIRTSDLFRVNRHLTFTFNHLTAHGIPPKHLYLRVRRAQIG